MSNLHDTTRGIRDLFMSRARLLVRWAGSQSRLGRLLNIAQPTINNWVLGYSIPRASTFKRFDSLWAYVLPTLNPNQRETKASRRARAHAVLPQDVAAPTGSPQL